MRGQFKEDSTCVWIGDMVFYANIRLMPDVNKKKGTKMKKLTMVLAMVFAVATPMLAAAKTSGGDAVAVPDAWKTARTLTGIASRATADPLQGVFELKCGKANKQGFAKVSAKLTWLSGKKTNYKAKSVDVTGRTVVVPFGGLTVTIVGATFAGNDGLVGGLSVESATVGGAISKRSMKFNVEMDSVPDFGKDGVLLEAALPKDVSVYVGSGDGSKSHAPDGVPDYAISEKRPWTFDKAPTLKYKRNRETGKYELLGLNDVEKPNVAALKLTYALKTGQYKGSFRLYVTNEATTPAGKAPKLKKLTVNVFGFVVDGVGYGLATLKKPGATWTVLVK